MSDLLTRYAGHGAGHDEMLRAGGDVGHTWRRMVTAAEPALGRLVAATSAAAELRRGHATSASDLSWRPDPLPVLLAEEEWAPLERAARQRFELLDAIHTDLYGERRLLTSGLLPPEVVVGHPDFLRAAAGIMLPGERQLTLAAIDIARNADGTWVVLDDRCDAPSGLGTVVENRHVMSQVLGADYRRAHVHRVGPFFRLLADQLHDLAPSGAGATPTVALLAPAVDDTGPQDDAAIASHLGVRLVRGEDLVVRDSQVWLGSLGVPHRVDVLLRRAKGNDCDPLELGAASAGTPGLVQAARAGRVSIANPLGSGVLGSPSLLSFLPRIARAVLGEELALGSVVTYWCGDRSMCSHVIANLGRLVIKSTRRGGPAIRGWELSIGEQAELAARISARPGTWVGQEPIQVSTTPTVAAGGLVAAPTGLRLFATSTADGYRLLPGGIGRVMRDEFATGPSPDPGTVKDVWVMASGPSTTARTSLRGELPRRTESTGLTPRVAHDLFRLGFHTERAEGSVRLLRAVEDVEQSDNSAAAILLDILGRAIAPGDAERLLSDASLPGSLAHDIAVLTRAATGAREQLSTDTWPLLASLHRTLARTASVHEDSTAALPRFLESLLAMSAIITEGTVRDLGWTLTMIGRRLARARGLTAALIGGVTHRPSDEAAAVVDAILLSAHESAITHRRRYQGASALPGLLDLLLWEEANPRSLTFQLTQLATLLTGVPVAERGTEARDQLLVDAQDLLTELAGRDALREPDATGGYPQLIEVLEAVGWRLAELQREITRVHFAAPRAAQFGGGPQR